MLPRIDPTQTNAWKQLTQHADRLKTQRIESLFASSSQRARGFSARLGEIHFDYSKNLLDEEALAALIDLADQCRLSEAVFSMRSGDAINETEQRAVLHTALRIPKHEAPTDAAARERHQKIHQVLEQMRVFSESLRSGDWKGFSGKSITDVVNIGIGGSDLGPLMACEALSPYAGRVRLHFVSNIDGAHLSRTLSRLNPETTFFLVASKTFTTQETMTNAYSARNWLLDAAHDPAHVARHFAALSTQTDLVESFGIPVSQMFAFWDWVGGRCSLWSAIGLSVCVAVGFDRFTQMLHGAYAVDQHFYQTPASANVPILMALVGIWNTNFLGYTTEAVLPYDQCLSRFPAYLQQAVMESNGKYLNRSGLPLNYSTSPVVWGEPGTNGQHAFYQLIHQGTQVVPCDFIIPARSQYPLGDHHIKLASHAFAQSQALMRGKSIEMALQELLDAGMSAERAYSLAPFRTFPGNRPSNTFLVPVLDPFHLGALVALYEHKIFAQGVIWNIFSFDQWGVELGKQLAGTILNDLTNEVVSDQHDPSTAELMRLYGQFQSNSSQ
jgi:glucose-6-phosphate isomerase